MRETGEYVASFDHSWQRLFTLAGLVPGRKGYQWHDLRHEFASYLIARGASGDDVRRLARHRDYRTTQKYLKAHETHLMSAAARMSGRTA